MKNLIIFFHGLFNLIVITTSYNLLEISSHWDNFKNTHNKKYESDHEEAKRFQIFHNNLKEIQEHNKLYEQGLVTYEIGINKFGDLTDEEFNNFMLNKNLNRKSTSKVTREKHILKLNKPLPDNIDWRKYGVVTSVKDQKKCGACWSFSAAGALESQYALKTKKLVEFSVQNLIDCSNQFGNCGCDGGWMDQAFEYIENYGIESENSYPYENSEGKCKFNSTYSMTKIRKIVDIAKGNETELQHALATIGPVSIGIDVEKGFKFYKSGIYVKQDCSNYELNHAVLIVGYGTDKNGNEYYIVKNSWGPKWGEQGYIRMARNMNNHCGVATIASYPII